MVIRDEQIATLGSKVTSTFAADLAAYVRERHSTTIVSLRGEESQVSALPKSTLEALVQGGIERARTYGIRWRSAAASFVVAMFVIAPNFDEDIRVSEFLKDPDIEPNFRMDAARRRLTEDQWNAIRRKYNVNAWGIDLE